MIKITPKQFKWTTDEQVYTPELASDGSILYCKEVNFGQLPNTGQKCVAHGVSGAPLSIFRIEIMGKGSIDLFQNQYANPGAAKVFMWADSNNVCLYCGSDRRSQNGTCHVIYTK